MCTRIRWLEHFCPAQNIFFSFGSVVSYMYARIINLRIVCLSTISVSKLLDGYKLCDARKVTINMAIQK